MSRKIRIGKRRVKQEYDFVVSVGNANLQNFLRQLKEFGYSDRAEGWACDYYELTDENGNMLCISDGYSPIGKRVPFDVLDKYDKKAKEILTKEDDYWMEKAITRRKMKLLRQRFVREVYKLRDEKRLLKEI